MHEVGLILPDRLASDASVEWKKEGRVHVAHEAEGRRGNHGYDETTYESASLCTRLALLLLLICLLTNQ